MSYSVWGITYTDALALIGDLAKHGVNANITAGGVAIYPDGTIQTDKMNSVCTKFDTVATRGMTLHEDYVVYTKR